MARFNFVLSFTNFLNNVIRNCRYFIVDKYSIDCKCRKPKPGLIEEACRKYDIDKNKSLMIGDKPRDVECGNSAGVRSILFTGGSLFDVIKYNLTQL